MFTKKLYSVLIALGVLATVSSTFAASEIGGKPEKADVIVTYVQPSGVFTPIYVAYEAGLFKKYGLNARLQLTNPQVSAQSVISGEADFYTEGSDLINARLQGGPVKYFGATLQQFVFQMWAAKEISAIQQLKGKIYAATTPRAALDIATREALKRNGLIPDKDVKILYVQSIPSIVPFIRIFFVSIRVSTPSMPGTPHPSSQSSRVIEEDQWLGCLHNS